jgi:hypothetical protein
MLFVKQFRSNRHRDGEVTSKLIVCPFATFARSIHVLVDSAPVNQAGINSILLIRERICAEVVVDPI